MGGGHGGQGNKHSAVRIKFNIETAHVAAYTIPAIHAQYKMHLGSSTSADVKVGEKGGTISLYKTIVSLEQSITLKWSPEVELCLLITKQAAIVQQNFQRKCIS